MDPIYNQSVIHPLALGCTLAAGFLILVLPRRTAVVPLVLTAVFIPMQQRIVFATLDFFMLRLLVLFGLVRIMLMGEFPKDRINTIDRLVIAWAVARIVTYTLLWQTSAAFINRMGKSFDALGIYFCFRALLRDDTDLRRIARVLAWTCVLLAVAMSVEHMTGRNAFAVFGGVPAETVVRQGRLRCQGAFAHPIMAGGFGASLLPLFVGLRMWERDRRTLASLAIVAALIVVMTSASSGPVLSCAAGIGALCLYPWRGLLPLLRWGVVMALVGLHFVMKAPVWALIARIRIVEGSTSYHRYKLIDNFITRFDEWWLLGRQNTYQWGYGQGDVTNQYVIEGVSGGLLTLVLFIALMAACFKAIGRSVRANEDGPDERRFFLWCVGASFFAHAVAFVGVSYFDQLRLVWFLALALAATLSNLTNDAAASQPSMEEAPDLDTAAAEQGAAHGLYHETLLPAAHGPERP